jgi:hypothetical protein
MEFYGVETPKFIVQTFFCFMVRDSMIVARSLFTVRDSMSVARSLFTVRDSMSVARSLFTVWDSMSVARSLFTVWDSMIVSRSFSLSILVYGQGQYECSQVLFSLYPCLQSGTV